MWMFCKLGFYSAVEDRNNHARVIVRARTKSDIVRLAKALNTRAFKSDAYADYPYRLWATKTAWSNFVSSQAKEIDYDNFKNGMAKRFDNTRMNQLHDVWGVMAGFNDVRTVGHTY